MCVCVQLSNPSLALEDPLARTHLRDMSGNRFVERMLVLGTKKKMTERPIEKEAGHAPRDTLCTHAQSIPRATESLSHGSA